MQNKIDFKDYSYLRYLMREEINNYIKASKKIQQKSLDDFAVSGLSILFSFMTWSIGETIVDGYLVLKLLAVVCMYLLSYFVVLKHLRLLWRWCYDKYAIKFNKNSKYYKKDSKVDKFYYEIVNQVNYTSFLLEGLSSVCTVNKESVAPEIKEDIIHEAFYYLSKSIDNLKDIVYTKNSILKEKIFSDKLRGTDYYSNYIDCSLLNKIIIRMRSYLIDLLNDNCYFEDALKLYKERYNSIVELYIQKHTHIFGKEPDKIKIITYRNNKYI